jgi:hypothetical protein
LTTVYCHTILRANPVGLQGEGIREIAEAARAGDRNHFEALVPRNCEPGGKPRDDVGTYHGVWVCPPAGKDRRGETSPPSWGSFCGGTGIGAGTSLTAPSLAKGAAPGKGPRTLSRAEMFSQFSLPRKAIAARLERDLGHPRCF